MKNETMTILSLLDDATIAARQGQPQKARLLRQMGYAAVEDFIIAMGDDVPVFAGLVKRWRELFCMAVVIAEYRLRLREFIIAEIALFSVDYQPKVQA